MNTTAQQMRAWRGPALLTYGFRPFFLGAALWAAVAMILWLALLSGRLSLPIAIDPVTWHAHEFLFGYLTAVAAGFLLTAVPNWTGRLPIVGWPLGALFGLWLAGRIAMILSATLPPLATALIDLAMPVALAIVIAREIIAGKNWRNLMILGLLVALILGNALFHWEAARGDFAAQGYGLRLGLAAGVMMIAVIGGRVVPSFTRNWLVQNHPTARPTPPMQPFDRLALLALLAALLIWTAAPAATLTALALATAGALHLGRLSRWAGQHTFGEPLVAVLHLAYAFVPLGALAMAVHIALPDLVGFQAAQHLWMVGGIGLMTLAVMTRATLGHTGQALHAGPGTSVIYLAITAAAGVRMAAGVWPAQAMGLYWAAAAGWLLAFLGFIFLYGPLLLRPKKT